MATLKSFRPVIKIAKYTMTDEVRHKSFIIMFSICAVFVFLIRGCYKGNYMINGQLLDAESIAWKVSKATFHIISTGAMFITALLSMRVFKRDREEGMQSCILSKSIDRQQYVLGKIIGLWALSFLFMFILHGLIFLIAFLNTGIIIPGYLIASLLCSLNLLFVIMFVLLLSLLLPDIMAFLCFMGISIVSFVAEGIYTLSHSQMAKAMVSRSGSYPDSGLTLGTVVYYLWPKLSGTQQWASSLIGNEPFQGFGSLYPIFNILFYCLICGTFLLWCFRKEDIF